MAQDLSTILDYANWVTGEKGRKITITASTSTVDVAAYLQGTTQVLEVTTTYDDSSHTNIVSVERTA